MNVNEVEQGDFINFGAYGDLYVCDPEYRHDLFWVTDLKKDRFDDKASGWTIKKYLAVSLLNESGKEVDFFDEEWD